MGVIFLLLGGAVLFYWFKGMMTPRENRARHLLENGGVVFVAGVGMVGFGFYLLA